MLPQRIVDEIKSLLRAGRLSQREIAGRLGVSRGTVNAIANDRRPERRRTPSPGEPLPLFHGPIIRCPRCGGRVYAPCRLCEIRDLKARDARRRVEGRA
jgi:hypothetical protein